MTGARRIGPCGQGVIDLVLRRVRQQQEIGEVATEMVVTGVSLWE
jgi:hypothetical protein